MNEQSTNQPTMETKASGSDSPKSKKHLDERYLAVRMTRSLHSVPLEFRSLYQVRGERKRLMGTFPEMAIGLAQHGAPPADVLFPVQAVEREVMKAYGAKIKASFADVQREETAATHRLDLAQLDVAAEPTNKSLIEKALEAAHGQRIATEMEIAKLAEMEASL